MYGTLSKFPTNIDEAQCKKFVVKLQSRLGTKTVKHSSRIFENCKYDQKQYFKNLKDVINKRVQHTPIHLSQDDGTALLSPIEEVEQFNDFFVSHGKNIAFIINVEIITAPCIEANSSSMFLAYVIAGENNQLINGILENKATGIDNIR